jgi:transcriptional regulatory protein RtcR
VFLNQDEVNRLRASWAPANERAEDDLLRHLVDKDRLAEVDRFDRVQLAEVLRVCAGSRSLSEAGRRTLFAVSRHRRSTTNDADRLRKYLARFGLAWRDLQT